MRRADTTFVNLRATLDDLQPLVDESKPVAKKLRPFLAELRPLARDARPTLRDLSALVRSPGASNDLIELTKSSVPVRDAAVGPTKRNGKERDGAFPGSAKALEEAIPELATARPYAPDLTGWFDDFSHSGLYDALGGASRAAPYVNLFAPVNGVLKPLLDPARAERRLQERHLAGPALALPGVGRARRDLEAERRLPLRRLRRAAGTVKRALLTLAARAPASASRASRSRAPARTPTRASTGSQFDNAFGLIQGGDLKVAGVRAGKITDIKLDKRTKHALVGFKIDKNGFGSLRTDASCESRPQSLIGEYFVDCQPGTAKQELKPGAVIPVTRTASTVAPDLVNDILRRPYRERLSLIIGSLGAGVAGNAENLNAAIRRASPALRETDKVLATLGAQNRILADLTVNADKVVGDLAANRKDVGRFVTEAKDTAQASAERRADIAAGLRELPGFLEQLQPTMKALGQVADDQGSALHNLDLLVQAADDLLRPARALRRRLAAGLQVAGQRVEGRRSRRQGGAAGHLPARRLRLGHAGARQEPLDRPAAPRRPQVRRREGPAQPRRPGLHRPRGAAAVRLRPDDLDVDLRPEQPHPQDRRLRRAVRRLRQRGALKKNPDLERECGSRLGPIQPGLNYPDVTKRAAQDAKDRGAAKRAERRPRPAAARRPGARRHARAVGPRDSRAPSTPSLPSVPTPSTPTVPTPTVPGVPPIDLPPLPGVGGTGGNDRGGSSPLPPLPKLEREDQQRPAGPDQAPRLPARSR